MVIDHYFNHVILSTVNHRQPPPLQVLLTIINHHYFHHHYFHPWSPLYSYMTFNLTTTSLHYNQNFDHHQSLFGHCQPLFWPLHDNNHFDYIQSPHWASLITIIYIWITYLRISHHDYLSNHHYDYLRSSPTTITTLTTHEQLH